MSLTSHLTYAKLVFVLTETEIGVGIFLILTSHTALHCNNKLENQKKLNTHIVAFALELFLRLGLGLLRVCTGGVSLRAHFMAFISMMIQSATGRFVTRIAVDWHPSN